MDLDSEEEERGSPLRPTVFTPRGRGREPGSGTDCCLSPVWIFSSRTAVVEHSCMLPFDRAHQELSESPLLDLIRAKLQMPLPIAGWSGDCISRNFGL